MKVTVVGLRGFPDVQGGVETHAEKLYPRLVAAGCAVEVLGRQGYLAPGSPPYLGVTFRVLPTLRTAGLEAVLHTFLCVLVCAVRRPDIVHFHAIGPSLWVPLARLAGLRVVMTHHGPDYQREKWGGFAKLVLRLGEWAGARFSHRVIAISGGIRRALQERFGVEAELIPNGVELPEIGSGTGALTQFDLLPGKYLLHVGRFVPEKRQLDLLGAFEALQSRPGFEHWKLVLVGAADHQSGYSREVVERAKGQSNVVIAGFQKNPALGELFRWAGVFVLPSTHEGLPIALLEALSYGLPVVASDIEANVEVGLPPESYARVGDVQDLAARIDLAARTEQTDEMRTGRRQMVAERYCWDQVAAHTCAVYREVIESGAHKSRAESDSVARNQPSTDGRIEVRETE